MFICHEHKMGYPNARSMTGHRQFSHGGDDSEIEEVDELPEGYTMTAGSNRRKAVSSGEQPRAEPRAEPRVQEPRIVEEAAPREAPTAATVKPVSTNQVTTLNLSELETKDPQAYKLFEFLRGIGTPDGEISLILNGFLTIEQFRTDPQTLASWLQKQIRNKANHEYIQMAVQQVIGPNADPRISVYGAPAQAAAAPFAPPWSPIPSPPAPYPGQGNASPYPGPGPYAPAPYSNPYPYFAPPFVAAPATPPVSGREEAKQDPSVLTALDGFTRRLDKMDEDRRIELVEARHKEAEGARDRELDGLKLIVQQAITTQTAPSDAPNKSLDAILNKMNEIQQKAEDDRVGTMASAILQLTKVVTDENRAETVGRTTEDVIAQVVPLVVDKIDMAGARVMSEMASLREQTLPKAGDAAEEEPELTLQQIEAMGEAEQEIIAHQISSVTQQDMDEAQEEELPAVDSAADGEVDSAVDEQPEVTEDSQAAAG